MEKREMFSFLLLINNLFTTGLSFLLLSISAIDSYQEQLISYVFYLVCILHCFYKYHLYHSSIHTLLLIKNWKFIINFYKSISGCWFIRLNIRFQIQSLQLLIFCMDDENFVVDLDCSFMFSFIISKLIILCIALLYCYIFTYFFFFTY